MTTPKVNKIQTRLPATLSNGIFYNSKQLTSKLHSEHATIGETIISNADIPPHVDIPEDYAEDYVKVDFGNSSFHAAPLLSADGEIVFTHEKLKQQKYNFSDDRNKPGQIAHASHPNSRTALILPYAVGEKPPKRIPLHTSWSERVVTFRGLPFTLAFCVTGEWRKQRRVGRQWNSGASIWATNG
jgi:hypothetical protein